MGVLRPQPETEQGAQERPQQPLQHPCTHTGPAGRSPPPLDSSAPLGPRLSQEAQQDRSLGEVSRSAAQEAHRATPLQQPLSGSCPCGCVGPAHGRRSEGGGQAAPGLQGQDTDCPQGPEGVWAGAAGSPGPGGGAHGGNEVKQSIEDWHVHTQADTRTHTHSPTSTHTRMPTRPSAHTHLHTPPRSVAAEPLQGHGCHAGDWLTPFKPHVHDRRPRPSLPSI